MDVTVDRITATMDRVKTGGRFDPGQILALIREYKAEVEDIEPEPSEDEFNDYIDETTDVVRIWGMEYRASKVLQALDPVAYRCAYSDYADTLPIGDYIDHDIYTAMDEAVGDVYNMGVEILDTLDGDSYDTLDEIMDTIISIWSDIEELVNG